MNGLEHGELSDKRHKPDEEGNAESGTTDTTDNQQDDDNLEAAVESPKEQPNS